MKASAVNYGKAFLNQRQSPLVGNGGGVILAQRAAE